MWPLPGPFRKTTKNPPNPKGSRIALLKMSFCVKNVWWGEMFDATNLMTADVNHEKYAVNKNTKSEGVCISGSLQIFTTLLFFI